MLYTIENDLLRVQIASRGGELRSVYGKKTGIEYLWQGDDTYWHDRSPILFPICGRLPDRRYTYRGKLYEMNLHGFVQRMEVTVTEQSADAITLSVCDTPETRAEYPFAFGFSVRYSVKESTLFVDFTVENKDQEELIFGLGAHPGFNLPLGDDAAEDYDIRFREGVTPRELLFGPNALFVAIGQEYDLTDGYRIPFTHRLLDDDGLFFTDMGDEAALVSRKTGHGVKLRFAGFPYLGFWHPGKTDAPFLCIEPWESLPSYEKTEEDLDRKPFMKRLASGGIYQNGYSIEIL